MARDSAETACPAPVPQDCQARAKGIAQGGQHGAQLYDHEKRYQAMRDAGPELYEAGEELADKLWILRCESRDEKSRAAAEAAIAMWTAAKAKARGESA
jgi:hypothetical protein